MTGRADQPFNCRAMALVPVPGVRVEGVRWTTEAVEVAVPPVRAAEQNDSGADFVT
jgi:hypothetical protein